MHLISRVLSIGSICGICAFLPRDAAALTYTEVDSFAAPTNATKMIYSPTMDALVLKNAGSAIVAIDIESRGSTTRLANSSFTDMSLSPSGRYVFAADYGGENIGYGTPRDTSYVHRLDLAAMTWDMRTAYIAGNVQAVSDTQVILKSIDQWVTFTNNAWGSGNALVPLNTPANYYASVYFGDFRYDVRTGRLLHGNSGSSSQEIQAFRIVNNEFVKQEGSGDYGSAQGYGGTVVLATDGSAFYYGALQVDPLDVTHNVRVFPERIYAANGSVALGDGTYYDAHTGTLLGTLPFSTRIYALNPSGDDFWAFDPASTTVHHFVPSGNVALASAGAVASASSTYSAGYPASAINNSERAGLNPGNGGYWNDATPNALPDWVQIIFSGAKTVDHVVVYSLQDNYLNPVEPTDTQTFSLYGITGFTVQGWDGAAWVTLATVSGNNLVKRSVTFAAYTTDRIRINITGAVDSWSRLTEVEAWGTAASGLPPTSTTLTSSGSPATVGSSVTFTATVAGTNPTGSVSFAADGGPPLAGCSAVALSGSGNSRTATCSTSSLAVGTHSIVANYSGDAGNAASSSAPLSQVINAIAGSTNVALASAGAVASASSTYSAGYPASAINNNERAGLNPGNGGYWNDATPNALPDWVQIIFSGAKTVDHVVVYSLQDNYLNPVEPNDTQTFSLYGITGFSVQGWDGAAWVTLATVSGNNLVKRSATFAAYSTDRIRINITGAVDMWSRLTEVEAWGQ